MTRTPFRLTAIVNDDALLVSEDGRHVTLPTSFIPEGVAIGTMVLLDVQPLRKHPDRRMNDPVKLLLNQLVHGTTFRS